MTGEQRGRQQGVREGNGYNEENGPKQTGLYVTPWRRWLATVSSSKTRHPCPADQPRQNGLVVS